MHWFIHLMGWDSVTDPQYAFSSGSGFVLVAWLLSITLVWWRTSCKAVWWCPGHGSHVWADPQANTTHKLCWYHHPGVKRKHVGRARLREFQAEHHLYLGDKPGDG